MTVDVKTYIKRGAEIVAAQAKLNASSWSRRIPLATHVIVEGDLVSVETDGRIAPQAAAFTNPIRHPLNYPSQTAKGERHFARTPKRDYLGRAWTKKQPEMEKQMIAYTDALAKEAFK